MARKRTLSDEERAEHVRANSRAYYARHTERVSARKRELYLKNIEHVRARACAWGKTTTGRASRRTALLRKYGLSQEQYDLMLEAQGNVCAVCGRAPSERRAMDIDHDHKSGEVRGLLDWRCNKALGFFSDPSHHLAAHAYLTKQHSGVFVPKKKKRKKKK